MLQKLIASILLTSYLTILIRPAIPVWDYAINYKNIVKYKCMNKDKPWMHCSGKCHLRKELNKVMDDEKNPIKKKITLNNKLKEFTNYFRKELITSYFSKLYILQEKEIYYTTNPFKGYLSQLFKPPPVFLFT